MQKAIGYWLLVFVAGFACSFIGQAVGSAIFLLAFGFEGGLASLFAFAYFYLAFLVIQIPVSAVIVHILLEKIRPSNISKRSNFLIILVLMIATQAMLMYVPPLVEQFIARANDPLQTGIKQYDLSDKIVFNTRDSAKNTLQFEGNTVIWIEHTKEAPPYPHNVWDLYVFTFDPASSIGETTKITDLTNATQKTPGSARLLNGKVYFTQDTTLFVYDPSTKKKEMLRKDVGHIFSLYENELIYSHAQNASTFGFTSVGLYRFDLATKQEKDTGQSFDARGGFAAGGRHVCFPSTKTPNGLRTLLNRYDLSTSKLEVIDRNLDTSIMAGVRIFGCTDTRMVYSIAKYEHAVEELHLYEFASGKDELLGDNMIGRLRGDTLYYWNETYVSDISGQDIKARDLATGKTKDVLKTDPRAEWEVSGDYAVYQKQTGQYSSDLILERLVP